MSPRYIARIVAIAISFYAAVWLASVAVLWASESSLVFDTDQSRQFTTPLDRRLFQAVALRTDDGLTLEGVALTHGDATAYWVLFCPAAGTSLHGEVFQEQLRGLWALGYNVLSFDYRGFGENRGSPTEPGVYADAATAYAYLIGTRRVPAGRVILAGRSLGSAVAVELATRVSAAGVLLFSAIDSVPRTADRLFPYAPASYLTRNHFDNVARIGKLRVPTVMVHSMHDELVPVSVAREMFADIHAPKRFVETDGWHRDAGFETTINLRPALTTFWPIEPERKSPAPPFGNAGPASSQF